MDAKVSAFVICVEAITFSLLYNLHDYTFKHLGKLNPYFRNIYTLWEGICSRNNLWGQKSANDSCLVSKILKVQNEVKYAQIHSILFSFAQIFSHAIFFLIAEH